MKAPASYIQDIRYSQQQGLAKVVEEGRRNVRKEERKVEKVEKEAAATTENENDKGDEEDKDEKGGRKGKKNAENGDEKVGGENKTVADPGKDGKPGIQNTYPGGEQDSEPKKLAKTDKPPTTEKREEPRARSEGE